MWKSVLMKRHAYPTALTDKHYHGKFPAGFISPGANNSVSLGTGTYPSEKQMSYCQYRNKNAQNSAGKVLTLPT